jgi:HEPN domain-containing protein
MDSAKRALVEEWLSIAQLDLDSARILGANTPPVYQTAVFHCQQAAEKAIKGFLIFHDQRFTKTHELLKLVELAAAVEPRFAAWRDVADSLTPYVAELRYPENFRQLPREEFEQALKSATDIYTFVLSLVPTDVHPKQ